MNKHMCVSVSVLGIISGSGKAGFRYVLCVLTIHSIITAV